MFLHPHIELRETENMGFGVFATKDLPANETIELSPVIVMSQKERVLLDQTELYNYIFEWGEDSLQCAMAMGYVPIYNHACPSNAEYFMIYKHKMIYIKTVVPIKKNQQIFINYQGTFDNNSDVWFDLK